MLALAALVAGFIDAIAGGGGSDHAAGAAARGRGAGRGDSDQQAARDIRRRGGESRLSPRSHDRLAKPADRDYRNSDWRGARRDGRFLCRHSALRAIMPYALLAAALYFALAPYLREHAPRAALPAPAFALGLAAPIGFYDGIFGPGAGSLYTLAFFAFAGANLITATAHTKVLNLTSNVVSLAVFLSSGHVNFLLGLPMALRPDSVEPGSARTRRCVTVPGLFAHCSSLPPRSWP